MNVAEPNPGMDGEIIHTLLGLLNQRIVVTLPIGLTGSPPTFSSA